MKQESIKKEQTSRFVELEKIVETQSNTKNRLSHYMNVLPLEVDMYSPNLTTIDPCYLVTNIKNTVDSLKDSDDVHG